MGYSWSELEDVFQAALKMPAAERESYVQVEANMNEDLKQTVLKMLRDVENADYYFDDLQEGIAEGLEQKKEDIYQPGAIVDKYKIIRPLGHGGMGQVYLAERNDQQFNQKVAIKCFSPDQVKENFFENFRNEQQFLASLNHAAIAHILDGGVTDDRIHYIIMEYVDGLPIDQYIQSKQLSTQEKLRLFLKICEAINFAHNRLILHLDIKPSNILVNSEGEVKLLDFGIAQKLGEPLKKEYLLVSPFYAAPEQLNQQLVSVATDVFQLGILLHLVLSNEFPFEKGEKAIESNRKLNLAENLIDKELLSVVNVCLNESPENRYDSVSSLIRDLENFLGNVPVKVHSHKWTYQTAKFIQRNKVKATLSLLLILTMLGGIIFSSFQAEKAKRNEVRAVRTSEFLLDIFRGADPNLTEGNLTVKEILDNSVSNIELKFDDVDFKMSLYDQLINIYTNVYLWNESRKLAEDVLARYKGIESRSQLNIMSTLAGNYRELTEFEKSDSLFVILLNKIDSEKEELPLDFKIENILAFSKSQQIQGKYDTALFLIDKASLLVTNEAKDKDRADIYNHYASVYKDLSSYDSALVYQKQAIDILKGKKGAENQNALSLYYNNQGNLLSRMSQYDSAIRSFEQSIDLKRDFETKANLDLGMALSNLGGVYYKIKNYDSALNILTRAIDIFKVHLKPDHNYIVSTQFSLANIYYDQREFEKAIVEYSSILRADTTNFGKDHPYVADDYIALFNCYIELGETDKAANYLKKAEKIITAKFDKSHQKTSYLYNKFGELYERQENYTMAQIYFQESYTLANKYLGEDHRYTKTYKTDLERISKIMKGRIEDM